MKSQIIQVDKINAYHLVLSYIPLLTTQKRKRKQGKQIDFKFLLDQEENLLKLQNDKLKLFHYHQQSLNLSSLPTFKQFVHQFFIVYYMPNFLQQQIMGFFLFFNLLTFRFYCIYHFLFILQRKLILHSQSILLMLIIFFISMLYCLKAFFHLLHFIIILYLQICFNLFLFGFELRVIKYILILGFTLKNRYTLRIFYILSIKFSHHLSHLLFLTEINVQTSFCIDVIHIILFWNKFNSLPILNHQTICSIHIFLYQFKYKSFKNHTFYIYLHLNYNYITNFQEDIIKMPPKKASKSVEPKKQEKEKQTKLFSKEVVEEKEQVAKSRSKQFTDSNLTNNKTKTSEEKWSYGNGKTPNKLFISSWNVNGIRSVLTKQDLTKYIEKSKPDMICIGETKIDEQAFTKTPIQIPGYYGYWNFCKCSAGYSGVAIFSKYQAISLKQDLPEAEHSQEGRVITLQFEKFYLITAYIPNSGQKLDRLSYRVEQYDQAFQNYCQGLKKKKTVIVCGDLNVCHQQIDIARPKGNEKTAGFTVEERKSFSLFLGKGWIDSFRELYPKEVKYSWWSMRTGGRAKNIGWRLDYFLINKQAWKYVKDSKINNDIMGSDHCPIELFLELN